MSTYRRSGLDLSNLFKNATFNRGAMWGVIIIVAMGAFEIFNFSSTQFALLDLLGELKFAGLRWATILAIAFCGIDFAGIARIFTPEQGRDEPAEVWYLFGAWLLAAAFNATLTWWAVSVGIVTHAHTSPLMSQAAFLKFVPIFLAGFVWFIRVLLIGTISLAGDRIFTTVNRGSVAHAQTTSATALQNQPMLRSARPGGPWDNLPRE